jgi:hypothetical protein
LSLKLNLIKGVNVFNRSHFNFRIIGLFFIFFTFSVMAQSPQLRVQDDTVKAPDVSTIPTIDGQGDDACWGEVEWQEIDQVWIPWGGSVGADDYTGEYKLVYSEAENLLYFLVQIDDDVFVDGYVFGPGDYYQYDIVEVFIDEDKSGGVHNYEGSGVNAENAFAYHIVVDAPEDGEVNSDFVVCDMTGPGTTVNYASHFPELAMRKDDNRYTWEFSLAVYDSSYDNGDPEASRVDLSEDKIIGLSLAYCDNDSINEDPKIRDNFFGSVWVPEAEYNNHWINADGFGTVRLISDGSGIEDDLIPQGISFLNYPNLFGDKTIIEFTLPQSSDVKVDVLNILGQPVDTIIKARFNRGRHTVEWTPENIPSGIYFCRMQANSFEDIRKIMIIK